MPLATQFIYGPGSSVDEWMDELVQQVTGAAFRMRCAKNGFDGLPSPSRA